MKSVDELITDILRREGGFSNYANDRGGATKFGVTQKTLSAWLGRPVSVDEVRNMEEATAREIYERDYYTGPRIDTLPEQIRPLVFDCAVNHGPRQAIKFVQRVINLAGFGPVSVDGALGPKTREAANLAQSEMGPLFNDAILEERRNFYRLIVARDPSQEVFLKGWLARADEFDMGSVL
ncbi:MAG: hypothetical protein NUW01_17430 [Gemmatimonadaceae bacterium]|nr:hypothetical protein [Gemmatimonadaceae bacterium]